MFNQYGIRSDIDHQPDEYQVNLEGLSASFYMIGNNDIRIVPKDGAYFKVSYSIRSTSDNSIKVFEFSHANVYARAYDYIQTITLTGNDGTVYTFGGYDDAIEFSIQQKPYYSSSPNPASEDYAWRLTATANTWMLTQIERPDGELITFHYKRDGVPLVCQDCHYKYSYWATNWSGVQFTTMPDIYRRNLNYRFLLPSYLSGIGCETSRDTLSIKSSRTIEMDYEIDRDDFMYRTVPGAQFDSIRIRNYFMELDTIKTRRGEIALNYTHDPATRLKLLSVVFLSNGTNDHSYLFSYNPTPLPAYNSRMTNIWGDYCTTIPYQIQPFETLGRRRMSVNPSLAGAEMLTCVTYPTGGRTEYTYEPNDFAKVAGQFPFALRDSSGLSGGLRIKNITDFPAEGQPESRSFNYSYDNGQSSGILSGVPVYHVAGGRYESSGFGEWMFGGHNSSGYVYGAGYSFSSENYFNLLSMTDGRHTTYSSVSEVFPDNGRIIYHFTNHDDTDIRCMDAPPSSVVETIDNKMVDNPFNSFSLYRGLLKSKEVFDCDGGIKVRELYNYTTICDSARRKEHG